MSTVLKTFTAKQIADALCVPWQTIRDALADVRPSIALKEARAWELCALPVQLQNKLQDRAATLGFRDAYNMLSNPYAPWMPPIPWNEVAEEYRIKAKRLHSALVRALENQKTKSFTPDELVELACSDYKREFGYAISEDGLRKLIDRTALRDRQANNFNRLELFLDDNAARPKRTPAVIDVQFTELLGVIANLRPQPSSAEEDLLWLKALEWYHGQITSGVPECRTKKKILAFLVRNAPFLAAGANAMRVAFNRKYKRWLASGFAVTSLIDGREKRLGEERQSPWTTEDVGRISHRAAFHEHNGRIAPAIRYLHKLDQLSPELTNFLFAAPSRKSHVARKLYREVYLNVTKIKTLARLGEHAFKMEAPHMSRIWSAVASHDWYQGDDFTMPIYYYVQTAPGCYRVIRGQTLIMIDVRSTCVLGFCLIPEANYNSSAIRSLITHVCTEHFLPNRGFWFEKGIWKTSRLLKGSREGQAISDQQIAESGAFTLSEIELGLRGYGVEFRHANEARQKPVEGVGRILQDLMSGEIGYSGRKERYDIPEDLPHKIQLVESGRCHPSKYFYSHEQWMATLHEVAQAYNDAPQEGELLGGMSPDEALAAFANRENPPRSFDAATRFMLSDHRVPCLVTSKGIKLQIRGKRYEYYNEETGRRVGEKVLAWVDLDNLDIIAVTDLNHKNPFCVERKQWIPAVDCPKELLAQEMQRARSHSAPARTLHKTLKAKFGQPRRVVVATDDAVELGRTIEQQKAEIRERKREGVSRSRRVDQAADIARRLMGQGDRTTTATNTESL